MRSSSQAARRARSAKQGRDAFSPLLGAADSRVYLFPAAVSVVPRLPATRPPNSVRVSPFPPRRPALRIRPTNPPTAPSFPTMRLRRFGMSIHDRSLQRSTLWRVLHWCSGEYSTPRLPIVRCCLTCPAAVLLERTPRRSYGTASGHMCTGRRMKISWIPGFDSTG